MNVEDTREKTLKHRNAMKFIFMKFHLIKLITAIFFVLSECLGFFTLKTENVFCTKLQH